jgi:hypothetical protein
MPLLLMGNKQRKKLMSYTGKHGMVYEYLGSRSQAPRSINGYPIFFAMRYLNGRDTKIVFRKVAKMGKTMQELK